MSASFGLIVDLDTTQCPQQYSIRFPCWNPKVDQNGHQSLGLTICKKTIITESDAMGHNADKHSCLTDTVTH